jgi:hypothetical protein
MQLILLTRVPLTHTLSRQGRQVDWPDGVFMASLWRLCDVLKYTPFPYQ